MMAYAHSFLAQQGIHLNAKAIPQWSLFLNEDDDAEPQFGWALGVGANYHFTPTFGLGADLIWSNEKQKIAFGDSEAENTFNFIKVPLLVHFNSDPSGSSVPFLGYVGVQFTMMQGVTMTVDGEEVDVVSDPSTGEEVDAETLFEDNNMGVVLGLGPGFMVGDHLMITTIVRWDYHFNNSENPDAGLFGDNRGETHHTSVGLDLGVRLIIGGDGK